MSQLEQLKAMLAAAEVYPVEERVDGLLTMMTVRRTVVFRPADHGTPVPGEPEAAVQFTFGTADGVLESMALWGREPDTSTPAPATAALPAPASSAGDLGPWTETHVEAAARALGCRETSSRLGPFCTKHREGHVEGGCPVAVGAAALVAEGERRGAEKALDSVSERIEGQMGEVGAEMEDTGLGWALAIIRTHANEIERGDSRG